MSHYYDCSLQLMPITWTVCQCSPCTNIAKSWLNLLHFYVLICQTNTTHCTPSASGFRHNCRESDCFQATPTPPLKCPQYVCLTLRYQPFSLNIVCPFPSPQNAVTEILEIYINTNKAHNYLQLTSELSGMNCQGLPSNWNWDTAENVHCSSGTVHIFSDILILNIERF